MNTYQRWKQLGRPTDYLMECWLGSQSEDPAIKEANSWAFIVPFDEALEHPDKAWEYVLFAAHDPRFTNHLVGVMAATALETLLENHGPEYIQRIEHQARTDRRFAWMLGGVWGHHMDNEVWNRVQAVWDRRGWDGIPAHD